MTKDSGTLNSGKTGTARVCFCGTEAARPSTPGTCKCNAAFWPNNAEDSRPAQAPRTVLGVAPRSPLAPTWRSVSEGASSHSANTPGAPDADCWTFPPPHSGTPRCTLTSVSPLSSDGSPERAPGEPGAWGLLSFSSPLPGTAEPSCLWSMAGKGHPHVYRSPFQSFMVVPLPRLAVIGSLLL